MWINFPQRCAQKEGNTEDYYEYKRELYVSDPLDTIKLIKSLKFHYEKCCLFCKFILHEA